MIRVLVSAKPPVPVSMKHVCPEDVELFVFKVLRDFDKVQIDETCDCVYFPHKRFLLNCSVIIIRLGTVTASDMIMHRV